MSVVCVTLGSLLLATLTAVEQIRGLVPQITQMVLQQLELNATSLNHKLTIQIHLAQLVSINTCRSQLIDNRLSICNLQYHSRLLAEQYADQILLAQHVEINCCTCRVVGKGHFEQGRNQTTARNVVASHHLALANQLLHAFERSSKVACRRNVGSLIAHLANGLRECATAQVELRTAHIDIDQTALRVLQRCTNALLNVAHLGCRSDNHRTRCDHSLTVLILLGHRQRVLTRRNIDTQLYGHIACSLHCIIQTSVLALVAAGPHPVCAE